MSQLIRIAAYARFSSSMQREESIDAQLRAIHEYAEQRGYVVVKEYVDRAVSATSDQRPEFQQMISDASRGLFDAVVIHKLDRFARSRYDSAIYKHQLKKAGVSVWSVSENLDDSPESVVLESVLEGMAEYYSRNLAREVEKGKRENALKGQHVGGTPPLGYTVDPATKLLVIEPTEAEAVRIIFRMYLDGASYTDIRDELNRNGYHTKRGQDFGKNSIHEILRNEKYTGVYVYSKTGNPGVNGKRNRHAYKSPEDIIRVEGAVPAIISAEDFQRVQTRMEQRRHHGAANKAIEPYLLSGKIVCGLCGSAFVGNYRKAYGKHVEYSSYRCGKKNGAIKCSATEAERCGLEKAVLEILADRVFDEALLPQIQDAYVEYVENRDKDAVSRVDALRQRLSGVNTEISNLVTVIAQTAVVSLTERLRELEIQREKISSALQEAEASQREKAMAGQALRTAFLSAKTLLANGTLANRKALVERFVECVEVFPDRVDVTIQVVGGYQVKESILRDNRPA